MAGALGSEQGSSTHGEGLQLGGEFPQLADRAKDSTGAEKGEGGRDLGVAILNFVDDYIGARWDTPCISHVDGFLTKNRAIGDQGSRRRRYFVVGEFEKEITESRV
jgi:hypothetical protein